MQFLHCTDSYCIDAKKEAHPRETLENSAVSHNAEGNCTSSRGEGWAGGLIKSAKASKTFWGGLKTALCRKATIQSFLKSAKGKSTLRKEARAHLCLNHFTTEYSLSTVQKN